MYIYNIYEILNAQSLKIDSNKSNQQKVLLIDNSYQVTQSRIFTCAANKI